MDIVVFGANGQTGRLLTRRALDKRHSVTAVTRNPDDFPFSDPLLSVVRADVREPSSLVEVVRDADAVVSTLGVPFSTRPIDTYSVGDRKSTRLNSSHLGISYAVFCLKKKNHKTQSYRNVSTRPSITATAVSGSR